MIPEVVSNLNNYVIVCFPCWTVLDQGYITALKPDAWNQGMLALISSTRDKPHVTQTCLENMLSWWSPLQQDCESVPALQRRACLIATTMAQPLSEPAPGRHPTALTRLPFKEAPLWGRRKSHPMLCSCKMWCTRHQQQVAVLPQLGVCLFVNHQHNTSHITGCVSLACQCGATLTEGRGKLRDQVEHTWAGTCTMDHLQNKWNLCVVSSRVANEKSYP